MEGFTYLPQIVLLLFAAVFVVAVFKHLNLSPVLGYLVAGAIIGQYGFALVDSLDLKVFAKFGVVFLLFAIGLELTIERLMVMRWHVFGFGTAQVLVTATVVFFVCKLFGLSVAASIVIGGALALSSTAVVLRVLADNNSQSTQVGRLALANLLLQDFAVVPLLVLVPLLASDSEHVVLALSTAVLKAFLAMIVIFFLGRMLLRPLFKLIASVKSNELFVAATLLVVLGTSLVTDYFHLSLALGAFIAGLLVAETQYQHQVEDTIMPFKDLLMGLFFMTVGMGLDLEGLYEDLPFVLGFSVLLVVGKSVIITGLSRFAGFPLGASIHAGLLLSQGSEFAFILFGLASTSAIALIAPDVAQNLLLIVTVTMAITPVLSSLGQWLAEKIDVEDVLSDFVAAKSGDKSHISDLSRHVVVVGFGSVGRMVAKFLTVKKVSYVVIDNDSKRVAKARADGFPVFHGDASKVMILRSMGIDRAKTAILAVDDNIYLKKVMRAIHKECPDLPIVARAEDLSNSKALEKIGSTVVVPEKYEAGLQMAGALLKAIGVSDFEVSRLKNQFRANSYKWVQDAMPEDGDDS